MKTEYEYIKFVKQHTPRRKTGMYVCKTKDNFRLGIVKWYSPWRRYCYFPTACGNSIYSEGCLKDIIDFIKQLMDLRKGIEL